MSTSIDAFEAWADGMPTRRAVLIILEDGPKPGMLDPSRPWIKDSSWIDGEALYEHTGAWSTSEQALVDVAASLLGCHDISLEQVLPRLSRHHRELVLTAIAHAMGAIDAVEARTGSRAAPNA